MDVAQLSIFLQNRSGGLADVVEVLARNGVDVQAMTLADMSDFGILRLIVQDPERTRALLEEAGFTAATTQVVAVEVPDRPGGLADTLRALREHAIDVEYMYSAARTAGERAVVIFRVDDAARTAKALRGAGVKVLDRIEPL